MVDRIYDWPQFSIEVWLFQLDAMKHRRHRRFHFESVRRVDNQVFDLNDQEEENWIILFGSANYRFSQLN